MNTPHTRQPLAGVTLWGLVIGALLVGGASAAFAHTDTLPDPRCHNLPTAEGFFGDDSAAETEDLTATDLTALASNTGIELTPKVGDSDAMDNDAGDSDFFYGKITMPALSAGKLTITSPETSAPTDAVLCRGSAQIATSIEDYNAEHTAADADVIAAWEAADAAATASDLANADPSDTNAIATLNANAMAALEAALRAIEAAEVALADAGVDAPADLTTVALALTTALEAAPFVRRPGGAVTALESAETVLDAAALALEGTTEDAMHEPIALTAQLAVSGTASEDTLAEYIVVVSHGEMTAPVLTLGFQGIMQQGTPLSNAATLTTSLPSQAYTFAANAPGLFDAKTLGSGQVKGRLSSTADAHVPTAGVPYEHTSGRVQIKRPVAGGTGTYTLTIERLVASGSAAFTLMLEYAAATALTVPTTDPAPTSELTPGGTDYYFFPKEANDYQFLTILSQADGEKPLTDTRATLYAADMALAMDSDGADDGASFQLRVPVGPGNYILAVQGQTSQTEGAYALVATQIDADAQGGGAFDPASDDATPAKTAVATPADGNPHYYTLTVMETGTLDVRTTGSADTAGILYGPSGEQLATNEDGGVETNFRIVHEVTEGQHTVVVTGKEGETSEYQLVARFFDDFEAPPAPVVPIDPLELAMACEDQLDYQEVTEASCQAAGVTTTVVEEVVRVEYRTASCPSGGGGGGGGSSANVNTCRTFSNAAVEDYKDSLLVTTDATGYLENPSGGGYRSGIGVISGWACAANAVEVRIMDDRGHLADTQQVGYGTSRPDVQMVGPCDHDSDTVGFGLTYNFNHLDEGSYTIAAYADDTMIGMERSFMVVHLEEFASDDDDRFLRDLAGMCTVEDFPMASDVTTLVWEQSIQNFVIEAVDMMEEGGAMQ